MRDWLTSARKAKKMTQGELARVVGVSQRSIAAYEAGERTPTPRKAQEIGTALDEPWVKFYEEEEGREDQ